MWHGTVNWSALFQYTLKFVNESSSAFFNIMSFFKVRAILYIDFQIKQTVHILSLNTYLVIHLWPFLGPSPCTPGSCRTSQHKSRKGPSYCTAQHCEDPSVNSIKIFKTNIAVPNLMDDPFGPRCLFGKPIITVKTCPHKFRFGYLRWIILIIFLLICINE